ncbi:hypothetical protein A1Q1_04390 [Trichosporon asahii var. asahii CBS 2479]|nr:hypothetical protein A1Q1_04390 [Trichosporon asahii var. asahii CBS 2479]EJT46878.1 hypothetical protein A1Q1_04390 [Trichosporon asahii var. asahii CBS 2479]
MSISKSPNTSVFLVLGLAVLVATAQQVNPLQVRGQTAPGKVSTASLALPFGLTPSTIGVGVRAIGVIIMCAFIGLLEPCTVPLIAMVNAYAYL